MTTAASAQFARQSFLGPNAQEAIERCVVGVVGLGGGGSHIVQQLAHIGFLNYVLFDADVIEPSNLNRLVGGTQRDLEERSPKVAIGRRTIHQVRPRAHVTAIQDIWQKAPELLRQCDVVFGCVDGFDQRRQLEAATRRYLTPLIDIGMDVFQDDGQPPVVAGQVMLSMPGCPCMTCMGFLNERALTREAARYGAAGGQPQVVWPNAILAASAVGICVDLVTDWSKSLRRHVYLSYRGNDGTVVPHARLPYVELTCPHFPLSDSGSPVFEPL